MRRRKRAERVEDGNMLKRKEKRKKRKRKLTSNLAIDLDILDQRLETGVVVLGPDEAQDKQVQGGAVEVVRETVQDVDFHAAHRILVEWIVSDAQDGWVDGGG
jgi:hypothetical protein